MVVVKCIATARVELTTLATKSDMVRVVVTAPGTSIATVRAAIREIAGVAIDAPGNL